MRLIAACSEGGATSSVLRLLQTSPARTPQLRLAALRALAALANDDVSCNLLSRENAVSILTETIETNEDEVRCNVSGSIGCCSTLTALMQCDRSSIFAFDQI